jgi:hypothetical protein
MKNIVKRLAQFALVALFPVSIVALVGILSLFLHLVTSIRFYTVSEHPATWIVSFIVVIIAYVYSSPDE